MQNPAEIHQEFVAAFNTANGERLLALYDDDAMFAAEPGRWVRGKAAIREAMKPFLTSGLKMEIKTAFIMERDDLVMLSAEWRLTGGAEPVTGKSSEVAQRGADGSWRYILDNPWSA